MRLRYQISEENGAQSELQSFTEKDTNPKLQSNIQSVNVRLKALKNVQMGVNGKMSHSISEITVAAKLKTENVITCFEDFKLNLNFLKYLLRLKNPIYWQTMCFN